MSNRTSPIPPSRESSEEWERQVDAEAEARQNKIQRLRIAEAGSGEYDDEKKPHPFLHFVGWMLLIAVLTAGLGGAGWYFWLRHVQFDQPKAVAPAPPPPPAKPAVAPTENYHSLAFQLQFDYPTGWKVAETTSNSLTLTSTPQQLKMANGKQAGGLVVMTIRHKQTSLPDYTAGDALAARESERLEYAKPSQEQRAATYISFLNYAGPAQQGRKGIDAIFVTGDSGYIAGQLIPQADIVKSDPLISFSFVSCPDTKCSTPGQPLTVAAPAWDDAGFSRPIRAILQSIVVQ